MLFEIDLLNVYTTNFIAVLLLVVLFICNFWRFQYKNYENKILILMIIIGIISSCITVASYYVDTKPGDLYKFLNHVTSTYIFCANMACAFLWMLLIETHVKCEPSLRKKLLLSIPMIIGIIFMFVNLFAPCVYYIDENNVYSRRFLYHGIFVIDVFYIVYAIVICILSKVRGGILKFFPIYLYIGPILLGLILETIIPGIAISWPCQAIAIAGVLASMQNEIIYRDQLTGLYNRSYLNYLQKNMLAKGNCHITGVMIDMDNFKHINDTFGHAKGDIALQQMAKILKEAVGDMGNVIRYAGDEFIVIINTQNDELLKRLVDNIYTIFDNFNKLGKEKYQLSIALGYSRCMYK